MIGHFFKCWNKFCIFSFHWQELLLNWWRKKPRRTEHIIYVSCFMILNFSIDRLSSSVKMSIVRRLTFHANKEILRIYISFYLFSWIEWNKSAYPFLWFAIKFSILKIIQYANTKQTFCHEIVSIEPSQTKDKLIQYYWWPMNIDGWIVHFIIHKCRAGKRTH